MTFYTSIAAIISAFIATLITDKLEGKKYLKAISVALISALSVFAVSCYENIILKKKCNPNIIVKTILSDNILNISLKHDNNSLEKVNIDFHIPGHITEVERVHPNADAKSEIFVEGEETSEYLSNRLEISIEDAKPNFDLNFKVHFKPISWPKINYIDRDLYCLTKIWKFKNERQYATEWRILSKDSVTEMPRVRLSPIRIKGDLKEGGIAFDIKPLREAKPSEDKLRIIWVEDKMKAPTPITEEDYFGPIKRKKF